MDEKAIIRIKNNNKSNAFIYYYNDTKKVVSSSDEERIKKLKELTLKMKTPEGLSQLEKESAWSRKQINLDGNSTPSTESNVSRYTLGENNEIRPNNSFLHDNVD